MDGAAGRKPWRYYYVMAFPLGSSRLAQEKLQEMTEMTAAIEQREEEYLRKVAARNAVVEAEKRVVEGTQTSKMESHVAWILRRLYATSAVLLLLAVAVVYLLCVRNSRESLPEGLLNAATITVTLLQVVNVGGWVAAHRLSVNAIRLLLVVNVVLIVGLVLALDEVIIVRRSHNKLREALGNTKKSLTQDTIALILNGGTIPSLVQRFVIDAPSIYLHWLHSCCVSSPMSKLGHKSVAIDQRIFFSPFWDKKKKECVDTALRMLIHLDEIVQPILIGELVMVSLQVVFTVVFLAVSYPPASIKGSKRQKQFSLSKPRIRSFTANVSTTFTRILIFGATMFGTSNTITSIDLLQFCSITDFHKLFKWIIVICFLSGIATMQAAVFVGCGWKQQLARILLGVAVASEAFILAESIKMTTRVIEVNIIAESEVPEIRQVYIKASEQTCSLIKHWISHICVGMSSSGNRANFNLSCQHEFIALLLKSFNFANSYLSWSIGIKVSLLIQLFLPALRQAAVNVVSFICCLSGDDLAIKTMEGMFQQSYPPIAYEEAVELYLKSLKVRDQGRIDAEREAFEKVWSARTGRRLSDIRTPRVIITASDFSAVVRTLMLHRLTAVCKLDVSLSVSDDGQLLLVRIFASDNLLLATLCETETYRLQFADAIDPGTLFWRDRKEVRTDQKVFDENTVKHRLKLLLAENVISPKEAIRFPGESVDRVSARINALSRISRSLRGLIRCCNPAPAFASYSPNIQRQFLYKKYHNKLDMPETYRRSAVLRTVDCIRITKRIINAEFDTKATLANHLVSYFHCLHSSSRFDINSRGALASSWATFWRRSHLPGEFYPDDHAILNFIGRIDPFRQPLQEVRDYFGEFIGLYCAWIGFYAKMMILPAFIAMVVLASEVQHSPVTALWYFYTSPEIPDDADKIVVAISLPELGLGLGMIVWSFVLIKLWERRSIWYQLQWGIDSCDTANDDDNFNHISGHDVVHKQSIFPGMVSFQRQLGSWLCVLALGGANMVVVLMVLLGQGVLVDILGERLAIMVSCLCQAILVQCNSACIFNVARALTKWENPHYSTDHVSYRNSVVAKMFLLHLVNTFTVLILLMMSSVGGLAILERILPPLRSLYSSYNSCIEDRVDIFIRLGTQLIALFTVQLCIRIILVLSTIKRFGTIQQRDKRYSRKEYEDETMLSPYPGPYKDYAQLSMQFGLVVMFSSVCPILPLIALVDCAVKLRQNALELCCIRQRPEPEGVKTQGHDENDIGLGPWESCIFLMVRLSVPVVLALTIFTVNSFDDISVERRIGYWLIGVLGISIMTQLLWFLIPRKSRTAEEARARNDFLVERYFGHAEVQRQKTLPSGKHVDKENVNIQEPAPSVEQSLHHYEERLELLQRLNVALRKRDDIGGSVYVTTTKIDVPTPPNQYADQETEDEPPLRKSEIGDEMVIGYFRPVRNIWPPTPQRQEIVKESDPPADMVGFTEDSPRPVEELKIDESGDDTIRSSVESENDVGSTGTPAPRVFSKLFKQKSASLDPSSVSDEVVPQADFEPGVFAPTDVVVAEIIHESSNDAELLEEKSSTPSSAIGPGAPLRQSRTSFFSRKPKHSDLILGDNVERKNDTLAVPDPPPPRRLSTFYRRAQPSSSTGTSIVAPREPVASNVSGFEKAEIDERSVNPVQSLHDQFDFLSDTHSEKPMQRRRLSGSKPQAPPSPPAVYPKVDLSGREAVREAANRQQFDFSADD